MKNEITIKVTFIFVSMMKIVVSLYIIVKVVQLLVIELI